MNDTIMAPTIASPSSEPPFGRIESNTVEQQTENMHAVIIPMEASSVQRIVAGQAITDLASAVKELIDNALDAGSRTINSKSRFSFRRTASSQLQSLD